MCKCDKEGEIRLQQWQFYSMMIQSVKALRRKNKRIYERKWETWLQSLRRYIDFYGGI